MARAKRRTVTVDLPDGSKKKIHQYHCSNCEDWFEPRNQANPDWPGHCKGCNTVLNYE